VFTDPLSFKPKLTLEQITRDVATDFGKLARSIESRGHDPHDVAHFLMQCMFCLFAEDVGLLPDDLFNNTVRSWQDKPAKLTPVLTDLFAKMKDGGAFGPVRIEWFNGGLFDDAPAIELTRGEIGTLLIASGREWSDVEPAIFGTLFERSLDPDKRSQIGAHYTSREDILLIVEPVVMAPLRRRWKQVRSTCEKLLAKRAAASTRRARGATKKGERTPRSYDNQINKLFDGLMGDLASVRILDPACGSGNFLYVAIQQLLDLEKEIYTYAAQPHIGVSVFPNIRPAQLHGIEINPFAAELAQVVIWIGYLQWMVANGFNTPRDPILDPLTTIECRDAILDIPPLPRGEGRGEGASDYAHAAPARWPQADYIIGNPPFLGSKVFRDSGLPDDYIDAMYSSYEIPNSSDLCCYWFERARMMIERSSAAVQASRHIPVAADRGGDAAARSGAPRVGLLATQGIRGGSNRQTLKRIKQTGDIFMAWADRKWILDGAHVQVSMVGFDDGSETSHQLDDCDVAQINSNLTAGADLTKAAVLNENGGIAFMGTTKGGAFDIDHVLARDLLAQPNPQAATNADVVRPWINGQDITGRTRAMWIIDYGCDVAANEAAMYEAPFAFVEGNVKPTRIKNRRRAYAEKWWLHVEPRPAMRDACHELARFPVTARVSKHRIFAWFQSPTLPDSATFCFARSDDYFFGVLHSSVHELWALRMGTQLEDRPRYTPTTCFETFALPWAPGGEGCAAQEAHADESLQPAARVVEDRARATGPGGAGGVRDDRRGRCVEGRLGCRVARDRRGPATSRRARVDPDAGRSRAERACEPAATEPGARLTAVPACACRAGRERGGERREGRRGRGFAVVSGWWCGGPVGRRGRSCGPSGRTRRGRSPATGRPA
jgi:hypothetical protein